LFKAFITLSMYKYLCDLIEIILDIIHCIKGKYINFQSKKQFNSILTQNSVYREEIESLRVERNRFDNLYRKLDKELSNLRKEKGELIEKSTQSYDAR
jgi:predicted nuclease with TOPRIM domain